MGPNASEMYPLQNLKYVEECCQELAAKGQEPSDALLVGLVRIQGIAERISRTFPRDRTKLNPHVPAEMILRCLEGELSTFRDSLPADIAHNGMSSTQPLLSPALPLLPPLLSSRNES